MWLFNEQKHDTHMSTRNHMNEMFTTIGDQIGNSQYSNEPIVITTALYTITIARNLATYTHTPIQIDEPTGTAEPHQESPVSNSEDIVILGKQNGEWVMTTA